MSNLECITRDDHAQRHLGRYHLIGDFRDLCAFHLIKNGKLNADALFARASAGGKIGGLIVKQLGLGICTTDSDLRAIWAAMGGRISGKKQVEKGLGIHAQTKAERLIYASMGGKASSAFKDKEAQRRRGSKGGPKNKGFRWYVDGSGHPQKYTPKQQLIEGFDEFINRTNFKKGRI